jgi:hypothetical protein
MTQHFTKATVSAAFWCGKCGTFTQHRIDNRRKGPCLDCIARLEAQHQVVDLDELRRKVSAQQSLLFGEST